MLKEELMKDLKDAMKEKNTIKKDTVQMVRAAILQIEKDQNIEVSDEKILEIIAKEAKRREDALAEYKKAQREDLVKQAEEEIKVLEEYLPKKMSKEELEEKIKEIIQKLGATTMKDMGKVMKQAKEEIGVAADGKTINEVVKSMLG